MDRKCHGDVTSDGRLAPPGRGPTACDLAIAAAAVLAVICVSIHAPSNLYAYAQHKRVGTALAMLQGGDWLLPRNQTGGLATKPPLYPWLLAAAIRLTGVCDDWVFKLPTSLAAVAAGVLVYLLGRRWYGRRVGLMAACLWATSLHMAKMCCLAATDMLLALWIIGAIACADRLLFHRAPRERRGRWAIGLWACMALGALTKGWGLVNLALVGGMLLLACVVRPGFGAVGRLPRAGARFAAAGLLAGRRARRAMKATRLGGGLLAMAGVLVPLWIAMWLRGGEEFRRLMYFEIFQRATGAGEHAPKASSVPAAAALVYYQLPASLTAMGGLVLALPRGWWRPRWDRPLGRIAWLVVQPVRCWFSRRGAVGLPVCWLVAVLVPFSLAHGFRPDYLLPCYPAVAMIGAWSVEELLRRRGDGTRMAGLLRHALAGVAIVFSLVVAGGAAGYAWHDRLGEWAGRLLNRPPVTAPETQWVLVGLVALGLAGAVLAVIWSLQWRLRRLAGVAMGATIGLMFLHTHMVSRHARTMDGESMAAFARAVRPLVGEEAFAVHRMEKLTVTLYLGRFGERASSPEALNASRAAWLITCDYGLADWGACRLDESGQYVVRYRPSGQAGGERKVRLTTLPGELGEVRAVGEPIQSQNWGRMYLIALRRPFRISGRPILQEWESGRRESDF